MNQSSSPTPHSPNYQSLINALYALSPSGMKTVLSEQRRVQIGKLVNDVSVFFRDVNTQCEKFFDTKDYKQGIVSVLLVLCLLSYINKGDSRWFEKTIKSIILMGYLNAVFSPAIELKPEEKKT